MTAQTPEAAAPTAEPRHVRTGATRPRRAGIVLLGVLLAAALAWLSLFVGSGDISAARTLEILGAWTRGELPAGQRDTAELIILERRLPRAVLAVLVGAALGLAGTLMQALTRNPLADPGLLGVNAGAYTAVVIGSATMGVTVGTGHVWLALLGALLTAVVVYGIGTSGRLGGSPAKLVLTGVAVGAVLSGLSFAITLAMPEVFDRVRFWSAGSLQGRTFDEITAVAPFLAVGTALALMLPPALNALALGDDAAVALGARPALTRLLGLAAVTLLCGAATAAAGPLSFVGLIVPHALRMLFGPDHRWLVPMSLLAAPILLLAADELARLAVAAELPTGVVTAFLGAPVLIALVRRKGVREL